jgi:CreA protein
MAMVDLQKLPTRDKNGDVHVVVETPRGSAAKHECDPELQAPTFEVIDPWLVASLQVGILAVDQRLGRRSGRRPGLAWLPMWGVLAVLAGTSLVARAEDLACLSTTFRILGANDKICISVFDDPKVHGVACHVSQARTGGIKGSLGLAEDPSRFSIACRQVGPITTDVTKLATEESVYSERTSVFFKHTHVFRIVDKQRNTLVYVALSDKIIQGSPQNSISTVPIMPWGIEAGQVR